MKLEVRKEIIDTLDNTKVKNGQVIIKAHFNNYEKTRIEVGQNNVINNK